MSEEQKQDQTPEPDSIEDIKKKVLEGLKSDISQPPIPILTSEELYQLSEEELTEYHNEVEKAKSWLDEIQREKHCSTPQWARDLPDRYTIKTIIVRQRAVEYYKEVKVGDTMVLVGNAKSLVPYEELRIKGTQGDRWRVNDPEYIPIPHDANRIVTTEVVQVDPSGTIVVKNTIGKTYYVGVRVGTGSYSFFKQMKS
jgi:hypothetical protein